MWSKNQYSGEWFEIEAALKVTGQGRVGADGMVSSLKFLKSHLFISIDNACYVWFDTYPIFACLDCTRLPKPVRMSP